MAKIISLSVCRDVRRMPLVNHLSRRDKTADKVREQVIGQARFGRRCFFCDFAFGKLDSYEIHNLDGDHTNMAPDNLVPICEICHAPFHLDLVARKWPKAPGKIIFLPEITQHELNNLVQAIFYSMAVQMVEGSAANTDKQVEERQPIVQPHTIYRRLIERADQVEQNAQGDVIRAGLSKPFVLSRVLLDMNDENYSRRDELLSGCRYLPDPESFIEQARLWNAHGAAFSALDIASWPGVAGLISEHNGQR